MSVYVQEEISARARHSWHAGRGTLLDFYKMVNPDCNSGEVSFVDDSGTESEVDSDEEERRTLEEKEEENPSPKKPLNTAVPEKATQVPA